MDYQQAERLRECRWAFCLALYNAREYGVSERTLCQISDSMRYSLSAAEVREQVRYLAELKYCRVEQLPDGTIHAVRCTTLSDLVEYNADAPASIARPAQKYW